MMRGLVATWESLLRGQSRSGADKPLEFISECI